MISTVSTVSTVHTVYGSLMHHRAELLALGDAAHQSPYNAPPRAPILYIKPANTFNAFGGALVVGASEWLARACVGLIYKPNQPVAGINTAQYAIKNRAFDDWQFALFCDFTLPHSSFYRPPLRFNARDGSLALPKRWLAASGLDLNNLLVEIWINDQLAHRYSSADWITSAQEQLEAVSEFIAWEAGDVLMLGCPPDAPLARAGDGVETRLGDQVFTRTVLAAQEAR